MDGVGAKIDADTERVFHEAEVFIASPEKGLEVGRDLQSDLQWVRWPPRGVDRMRSRPTARRKGCGLAAECEGTGGTRRRREPKLWAD
jgi:hypothetical protein